MVDVGATVRVWRCWLVSLRSQLRLPVSLDSKLGEDRFDIRVSKERGYHIVGGLIIALVGLIVTVTVHSSGAKYAGLCILLLGSYVSPPLTVVWLSGNTPGMTSLFQMLCRS